MKAQHVSSGIPLIIRRSNCICRLWFTYAYGDRPLVKSEWKLRLDHRPATTCVCNPEAANTVRAPDDERCTSRLHTHVVTGRSQVWVPTQTVVTGRSQVWVPTQTVNQRLQIQLELLMMSSIPLETCWAFNERWNNKFCYRVASCWFFLLSLFKSAGITVSHFFSMLPSTLKYLCSVEPVRMHFPAKQPCTNDTVCNSACNIAHSIICTRENAFWLVQRNRDTSR